MKDDIIGEKWEMMEVKFINEIINPLSAALDDLDTLLKEKVKAIGDGHDWEADHPGDNDDNWEKNHEPMDQYNWGEKLQRNAVRVMQEAYLKKGIITLKEYIDWDKLADNYDAIHMAAMDREFEKDIETERTLTVDKIETLNDAIKKVMAEMEGLKDEGYVFEPCNCCEDITETLCFRAMADGSCVMIKVCGS